MILDNATDAGDEIHNGDFFGDTTKMNPATGKPYISNVTGCTVIGQGFQILEGQFALLNSLVALGQFNTLMNKQPFLLEVRPYGGTVSPDA